MSDGIEGSIRGITGGGIAATHPAELARIVHVAAAVSDEHVTLKAAIFPIASCRIEDLRFEFDSSFVKPEIATETALLATLIKEHTEEDEKPPLSIFGHADPVGNDDYNKQLSGRRAQAIFGLLTRDTDLWEDLYTHPLGGDDWGTRSVQTMLEATGYSLGPLNGQQNRQMTEAIEAFQGDQGLKVDGFVGPDTRKKLFLAYMDKSCRDDENQAFKLEKANFLAQGADSDGKGDYQGCSEFNPITLFSQTEQQKFSKPENSDERNTENASNRRVMTLLFRPGSEVLADRWPCPRVKEGVAGCKKRFWSDGEKRRGNRLQDVRREFEVTRDTFACRFYQRLISDSIFERSPDILPPLFRSKTASLVAARLPSVFTHEKSFLKPSSLPLLRKVMSRLQNDPNLKALVIGHASPKEEETMQLELSLRRACCIRALLTRDVEDLRQRFHKSDPISPWDFEEVHVIHRPTR